MKHYLFLFAALLLKLSVNAQWCTTSEWNVHQSRVAKIDTTSLDGIGEDLKLWQPGQEITVGFVNGSPTQQERIFAIAKQWEQFASVSFKLVPVEMAQLRILLANSRANYTFIGTDILKADPAAHNMQIDISLFEEDQQELKQVVLHQFGHVLGMMHEHDAPEGGIQWEHKTVYKTFSRFGWNKDQVNHNIFELSTRRMTNGFFYDANSIMHSYIPAMFTTNGYSVACNAEISEGDKSWAASQYPFREGPVNKKRPAGLTIR